MNCTCGCNKTFLNVDEFMAHAHPRPKIGLRDHLKVEVNCKLCGYPVAFNNIRRHVKEMHLRISRKQPENKKLRLDETGELIS